MILLIDNYDSFTFNLYQLLAPLTEIKIVRNDKITLTEIKNLKPKGIILSPGPGRPEKAGICVELIKNFYQTFPLLGVCLGHQAIGMAFGAKVIAAPTIVHGKSSPIFHHQRFLLQKIPSPFLAGRYHSLMIDPSSLPTSLCIEAENNEGLIMAIKHRDYPCYGVQFHPESILTPEGNQIVNNFWMSLC